MKERNMSKIALFPGRFQPFHVGHFNIMKKAFVLFDAVQILVCDSNLEKARERAEIIGQDFKDVGNIGISIWDQSLDSYLISQNELSFSAIIKGIRADTDILEERHVEYANEDLGILIPVVYISSPRESAHISRKTINNLYKYTMEY
jgi:pantetheine-phosphate adenylyltransferase